MALPPTEWMERVIRINTVTHNSNEEMIRFLLPLLKQCGLKIEEQRIVEAGTVFKNVIAFSHTPDAPDLLVFNTHLDTVSYGSASDWTKTNGDPFRATRVRDRIYGLGTADVKLDLLCKIWAAKHTKPWIRPIAIVGTYGEERGLIGAGQLLRAKKIKPRYTLVGEPSNLELIYAHKGHLVFTIGIDLDPPATHRSFIKQSKGKAAHSATPELGDNALRKALMDIFKRGYGIVKLEAGQDSNRIPDLCQAELIPHQTEATKHIFSLLRYIDEIIRDLKKRRDTRFVPSHSTLSLNMAKTKGRELQLTFDVRSLPDINLDAFREKLTHAIGEFHCHIVESHLSQPLRGRKEGKLMKAAEMAMKECGLKVIKKTKASSTEAALYSQHGSEAIVFGPGLSLGNVHRPNEFNSLRQLDAATRFYTTLMKIPAGVY